MEAEESLKLIELELAVKRNDIDAARKFLEEGLCPHDSYLLLLSTVKLPDQKEFIKLPIQHRANITNCMRELWRLTNDSDLFKELVCLSIEYHKDEISYLQKIFYHLVNIDNEKGVQDIVLEVFEILLSYGLPLEEPILGKKPLLIAIACDKTRLVVRLLRLGVDVRGCLYTAVTSAKPSPLRLLLERGIDDIYDGYTNGHTALHSLCQCIEGWQKAYHLVCIKIILEHNPNYLNILNSFGHTPIMYSFNWFEQERIIVKKLAELKFEKSFICNENVSYLQQHRRLQDRFEMCLKELQRMKDLKIYNNISCYDILKLRKNIKKLVLLTQNRNFIAEYKKFNVLKTFEIYGEDLDKIFEETFKKENFFHSKKDILYSILKDYEPFSIPREISDIIAYYAYENYSYEFYIEHIEVT